MIYVYIYAHKFETIAMKRIPVDQSSCKSLNELFHEY